MVKIGAKNFTGISGGCGFRRPYVCFIVKKGQFRGGEKVFRPYLLVLAIYVMSSIAPALAGAPSGFQEGRNSGVSPIWKNKELTFIMTRTDCQARPYGDGRGESDCLNGSSRSQVNARKQIGMGKDYQYFMEIWVDPDFRYNGKGWGGVNYRSRLWIAEWQRQNTIKNHMYEMYLDSVNGAKFEDKTCFRPSAFGKWNTFEMRVRWSTKDDGYLQVKCNGTIIYALKGANAVPPDCGKPWKNQCQTKHLDFSEDVLWSIGPSLKGYGMRHADFGIADPFPPFPETGITMKVRNLYYGRPKK